MTRVRYRWRFGVVCEEKAYTVIKYSRKRGRTFKPLNSMRRTYLCIRDKVLKWAHAVKNIPHWEPFCWFVLSFHFILFSTLYVYQLITNTLVNFSSRTLIKYSNVDMLLQRASRSLEGKFSQSTLILALLFATFWKIFFERVSLWNM